MKTPEGKLKDLIKADLARRHAYVFMPVQSGYGAVTVDFLVSMPYQEVASVWKEVVKSTPRNRFLAIETKAEGKKPTPRQELVMRQVIETGGAAFWCDSYNGYLMNMTTWGFNEADGPRAGSEASVRRSQSAPRSPA